MILRLGRQQCKRPPWDSMGDSIIGSKLRSWELRKVVFLYIVYSSMVLLDSEAGQGDSISDSMGGSIIWELQKWCFCR